jgi:hypothetical protein
MSCKSHVHIIIVMMTRDPILQSAFRYAHSSKRTYHNGNVSPDCLSVDFVTSSPLQCVLCVLCRVQLVVKHRNEEQEAAAGGAQQAGWLALASCKVDT